MNNQKQTQRSLDDLKTIDLEEGARLVGGTLEAAKDMIRLLMEGLPDDLNSIKQCYSTQNMEGLYLAVHRFYGGLCYCGVPRLRVIIEQLKSSLLAKSYVMLDEQIQVLLLEAARIENEAQKLT